VLNKIHLLYFHLLRSLTLKEYNASYTEVWKKKFTVLWFFVLYLWDPVVAWIGQRALNSAYHPNYLRNCTTHCQHPTQSRLAHFCNPSYMRGWDGEDSSSSLGKSFTRPHLQNKQSKTEWRRGSCGRAPALQVWNPEFKPQSCQKKKKKKKDWWDFRSYKSFPGNWHS
jgi:hypothetical protein